MKNDLRESIEALRALAPRLNQITDQATETIKAVEQFLSDKGVGITAYAKVDGEDDTPAGTYIAYKRHAGKFRIVIVDSDTDGDDVNTRTWAECPRDEKLAALAQLPSLLSNIARFADVQVTKSAQTVALVSDLIKALDRK